MKRLTSGLRLSNLNRPSNKTLKFYADVLLYTLPLYSAAIVVSPLKEDLKLWLGFGISVLVVTLKGLTKFTAEGDTSTNKEDDN